MDSTWLIKQILDADIIDLDTIPVEQWPTAAEVTEYAYSAGGPMPELYSYWREMADYYSDAVNGDAWQIEKVHARLDDDTIWILQQVAVGEVAEVLSRYHPRVDYRE